MNTHHIQNKNMAFWVRTSVCVILFSIICVFSYQNMKEILHGVQVSAQLNTSTTTSVSKISGVAKNATYLSLNGREIFIDKNGAFTEDVALPDGYSVVTLTARDAFGTKRDKTLEVYTTNSKSVAVGQSQIINN